MYQKKPTHEDKIENLLRERAGLGIHCFEFVPLLHITQQNARINGLRKKYGCICKFTDVVLANCPSKKHFINKNDTTYLIEKSRPTWKEMQEKSDKLAAQESLKKYL